MSDEPISLELQFYKDTILNDRSKCFILNVFEKYKNITVKELPPTSASFKPIFPPVYSDIPINSDDTFHFDYKSGQVLMIVAKHLSAQRVIDGQEIHYHDNLFVITTKKIPWLPFIQKPYHRHRISIM